MKAGSCPKTKRQSRSGTISTWMWRTILIKSDKFPPPSPQNPSPWFLIEHKHGPGSEVRQNAVTISLPQCQIPVRDNMAKLCTQMVFFVILLPLRIGTHSLAPKSKACDAQLSDLRLKAQPFFSLPHSRRL